MSILGAQRTHPASIGVACVVAATVLLLSLAACGGGGAADPLAQPPAASSLAAPKAAADPTLVPLGVRRVNTTQPGDQTLRAMGATADGGVAVAWLSSGEPGGTPGGKRLSMQRYDAGGQGLGSETPIAFDVAARPDANVAVLADGSILLAYSTFTVVSVSASQYLVRQSVSTERFDTGGAAVGGPLEVTALQRNLFANPTQFSFLDPAITTWSDGSYLVTWTAKEQEPAYPPLMKFFAQRYDSQGAAQGGARLVAVGGGGWGVQSTLFAALPDGGFLAALTRLDMGIQSTAFTPFDSAERTATIPAAASGQTDPGGTSLLPLASGGYVRWSVKAGAGPLQILDNAGALLAATAIAPAAAIAALTDGGFVVLRNDSAPPPAEPQLVAQRYDGAGVPVGAALAIATNGVVPRATALAGGGLALGWTTTAAAAGDLDVYLELLQARAASWQATVRACRTAAAALQGSQHRQFMSNCLKAA
ncbi:hypothetical protein [Ramlibacter sp.]|uniref:hypothetical protein n=1 Tax=Ramlibacter sp. TaxID=1917967 RepID=UPI002C33A487|nr:hypothetical protein [Ramlibacter sp.]HWI82300.1 hypothetical protein [Ramlibacter sp.]